MANLKNRMTLDGSGFKRTLEGAGRQVKSFASKAADSFKSIGSGLLNIGKSAFRGLSKLGLGLAAGMIAATREGSRFRNEMAQAKTMMQGVSGQQFKQITEDIIKLSAATGLSKTDLTKALYDSLSAGVPPNNVIDFLIVAGKAAVAGATEIGTAVDALSTLINAYGLKAEDAGKVSDLLFTSITQGKTTLVELGDSLGMVAGLAAQAGVSMDDLLASIATVTNGGIKTAQAATGIRAALAAILKPSEDLQTKLTAIGTTGEALLKSKGIVGAFAAIVNMAGGSNAELTKLIPSIESLPAILALTGTAADKAKSNLAGMADSSGAMTKAFGEMDTVRHWQRAWQSILGVMTRIGVVIDTTVAPYVNQIIDKLNTFSGSPTMDKWLDNLSEKIKFVAETVKTLIGGTGEQRSKIFEGMGHILQGALQIGAEKAVSLLLTYAPKIGNAIGSAIREMITGNWDKEKNMKLRDRTIEAMGGRDAYKAASHSERIAEFKRQRDKLLLEEGAALAEGLPKEGQGKIDAGVKDIQTAIDAYNKSLGGQAKAVEATAEVVDAKPIIAKGVTQETPEPTPKKLKAARDASDMAANELAKIGGGFGGYFANNYSPKTLEDLTKQGNTIMQEIRDSAPTEIGAAIAERITT